MSEHVTPKGDNKEKEEIDLGQLFVLIGGVFQKIGTFFTKVFTAVYKVVLLFLVHIFKQAKWYGVALVLGGVIGFVLDASQEKMYGANMSIETNFNSSRQVYENIRYLHQLAAVDKDSVTLAKRLNISVSDAATLKGFFIIPDIDENDRIKMFSGFYTQLDSLAKSQFSYKEYVESLSDHSFKTHNIGVASTDRFIYNKLNKTLPEEISNNEYLSQMLEITNANNKRKLASLQAQETQIDSLVKNYLYIRNQEAKKKEVSTGTTLYMGSADQKSLVVDESRLVDKIQAIKAEQRDTYKNMVQTQKAINVIASFPIAGYDILKWYEHKKVQIPLLFLGLTLLFFLLTSLAKYVTHEQKRLFS